MGIGAIGCATVAGSELEAKQTTKKRNVPAEIARRPKSVRKRMNPELGRLIPIERAAGE